MPSPNRTVSQRMAVQHAQPSQKTFEAALVILQQKAIEGTIQGELVAAARYLAKAITVYSEAVQAGLPDAKANHEESVRFREDEAARLRSIALEALAIMNNPGNRYSTLSPVDEQALAALLQKVVDDSVNPTTARERRAKLRPQSTAIKTNRHRLCHAISHAWFIATGEPQVPGRKLSLDQLPYGEFHDFIRAVLALTKEASHIPADELHRDMLHHFKQTAPLQ